MKTVDMIYQDEWASVLCADNRIVLADFAEFAAQGHPKRIDHVITDTPYGNSTHDGALTLRRSGTTGEAGAPKTAKSRDVARKLVDFESIAYADFQAFMAMAGSLARRWVISFCERRYVEPLEQWTEDPDTDAPLRFVREGIYVKPNGMPQVSGDRPAQGWESIAILHRRTSGHLRWNGGGYPAIYIYNKPHDAKHPTQKPLSLMLKVIDQFTDPGDVVLDPFGGSGVTAVACKMMRRKCILIEQRRDYCQIAADWLRATQPMMEALARPTYEPMALDLETA